MRTLFALAIIFLAGCISPPQPTPTPTPDQYACSQDSDCRPTGCSGEICASRDIVTTCELRSEDACYRFSSCGCLNGQCAWAQNERFRECVRNITSEQEAQPCGGAANLTCPEGYECELNGGSGECVREG